MAVLTSVSCFAALGGDVTSIQADQAHMRAQRQMRQATGYAVHEMTLESGNVVHEFVSPDGKVFGVAWGGQSRPDLKQLLGSYYDEYRSNAPTRLTHHPVTIRTGDLVVQFGGHQRALTGRAYLPALIPSGVRIEEIK
jgi:hypothetical protein